MDALAKLACASNIGPARVNHKVSATGDGTRKQGDVEISNFPISLHDGFVIDFSFVCEIMAHVSSRALGEWNNGVRHAHNVFQTRANVKNNKYSEIYGLVHKAFAPAIVGLYTLTSYGSSGFLRTSRRGRTMRACKMRITSKIRLFNG